MILINGSYGDCCIGVISCVGDTLRLGRAVGRTRSALTVLSR